MADLELELELDGSFALSSMMDMLCAKRQPLKSDYSMKLSILELELTTSR